MATQKMYLHAEETYDEKAPLKWALWTCNMSEYGQHFFIEETEVTFKTPRIFPDLRMLKLENLENAQKKLRAEFQKALVENQVAIQELLALEDHS